MQNNDDIKSHLQHLGLTEVEAQIYLYLLKNSPSTVLNIARNTKINRTTVHLNLENLKAKDLVTFLKKGSKRLIVADPPEKFRIILEKEKLEINRKIEVLPDFINSIYSSINKVSDGAKTEIKYYEGKVNVGLLYDDILSSKEVKSYVNSKDIISVLPENEEKFITAVIKNKVKIWDLQDYSARHPSFIRLNEEYPNYHLKFFPPEVKLWSMDYLIYRDSLAIVTKEKDITAVVIKNRFLFENSRTLYDLMWKLLG